MDHAASSSPAAPGCAPTAARPAISASTTAPVADRKRYSRLVEKLAYVAVKGLPPSWLEWMMPA